MTPTVDQPHRPWRIAAGLSAAPWLLSLLLPVAHVLHGYGFGGWRMLGEGWGLDWRITIAWCANPAWFVLVGNVLFSRSPPLWLASLVAPVALVSLVWWEVMGPGAWVWLASFAPWPWAAWRTRRKGLSAR